MGLECTCELFCQFVLVLVHSSQIFLSSWSAHSYSLIVLTIILCSCDCYYDNDNDEGSCISSHVHEFKELTCSLSGVP